MLDLILKDWHFMRWLRLGIGLYFGYVAISGGESVLGFIAAFFLIQAVFNTGCGPAGCAPRSYDVRHNYKEEPDFEIVKPK
ncbi:MAG: hypothetical protein J5I52_05405 [Saprospiraceae bacterium]|nr:MAG: hypothetical protein UZ09_BCD002002230 [Bacteroidetes bacterium OLB9]MCO6463567.1 hypothetical protein [Saprospiraceae bacterium]MCZ2338706.1 hypothetical protein [Chitinophagales bacterium]